MRLISWVGLSWMLVLAIAAPPGPALAQARPALRDATNESGPDFSVLVGSWVRPDGGYRVTIESVAPDGTLDASYANPRPLPFSKAEASRDGEEIEVFLELTAGGYGGSTYTLTYDPEQDVLRGVYFQAVAQQRYMIFFERAK
jgi:hypothetical protein